MSENTPPTSEPSSTPAGNDVMGSDPFDVNALLQSFLKYIKDPKLVLSTIQSVIKGPGDFFGSGKDGDVNHALGFYLVTLAYLAAFGILGSLFQGAVLAIFFVVPVMVLFGLIGLAIGAVILWGIGKFLGKGDGSIVDGAKIISFLAWIGLISSFPLFVFFPFILQTLISIGCLVLWAYLLNPSVTTKFKTTATTHTIAIWAIAGVFALISLFGLMVGTGAKVVANNYEDVIADAEQKVKEMEAEYLEKYEAERAAAAAAAEQQAAAAEAAAAASGGPDPKSEVKRILGELKNLGAVEVPSELKQAFRKLNGHLKGADFSGIKVSGLDLRMIDLTNANFEDAVMTDWTFHGLGNTPASILDGANFSGATMQNINMKGVSARGADFSKVTLVGVQRGRTVVDLSNTNLEGADFSDILFSGDPNAKSINFNDANLQEVTFEDSHLPRMSCFRARMRGTDFKGATLQGMVIQKADIRDAIFKDADLTDMELGQQWKLGGQFKPFEHDMCLTEGANFEGANLNGVDLNFRNLRFCNFKGASFVNADLEGGNFVGSSFEDADLSNANLKRANFSNVDFSGAKFRNNDWEHAHTAGAQLKGVVSSNPTYLPNLPEGSKAPRLRSGKESDDTESMVNGSKSNWVGADLKGISFERLRIDGMDFTGANLEDAVFNFAELGRCNFSQSNLDGASFAFARIFQCNFDEASMKEANFYGATFGDNTFKKAILTEADFSYTGRANWAISSKLNFEEADLKKSTFQNARLSYLAPSHLDNITANNRNTNVKTIGHGGNSAYIDFDDADLSGANLRDADLDEVSIARANLTSVDGRESNISGFYATWDTIWKDADFTNANLAFGQIWHSGAETTDGKSDFVEADVRGANLFRFSATPGTFLGPVDFTGCNFANNPWKPADDVKRIGGTDLAMINFSGAKFVDADMRRCGFSNTNISGADFSGADLSYSSFSVGNGVQAGFGLEKNLEDWSKRYHNVNFKDAKFDEANVASGDFQGSNFNGVSAQGIQIHRNPNSTTPSGQDYMNYAYNVPASL